MDDKEMSGFGEDELDLDGISDALGDDDVADEDGLLGIAVEEDEEY